MRGEFIMRDHRLPAAPDYTNAALVMFAVNLMALFFALWAIWGIGPVLVLAVILNHAIGRIAARRDPD